MLKAGALAFCLAAVLGGCASTGGGTSSLPSPEADSSAPGMIPSECEALLQKSQEWGYRPGEKWKPASLEQAKSVLGFFENFALVPAASSDFFRAFAEAKIPEGEEPQKEMFEQTGKAQVCDFSLASQFLTELAKYPWPKAERPAASKAFHRFALNQQARSMPLLPRMAAIQAYSAAAKAGLVSGGAGQFLSLGKEGERVLSTSKTADDEGVSHEEMLQSFQREVVTSEKLREKMARMLPLP